MHLRRWWEIWTICINRHSITCRKTVNNEMDNESNKFYFMCKKVYDSMHSTFVDQTVKTEAVGMVYVYVRKVRWWIFKTGVEHCYWWWIRYLQLLSRIQRTINKLSLKFIVHKLLTNYPVIDQGLGCATFSSITIMWSTAGNLFSIQSTQQVFQIVTGIEW